MVEAAGPDAAGTRAVGGADRRDVCDRTVSPTVADRDQRNRPADGGTIEILTMLAWTIYISFLGVLVLMFLSPGAVRAARAVALGSALAGFFFALKGFAEFEAGKTVEVANLEW